MFNAVTRSHKAPAANYPFCTIEPNLGVVSVPDARLAPLAKIARVNTIIPALKAAGARDILEIPISKIAPPMTVNTLE